MSISNCRGRKYGITLRNDDPILVRDSTDIGIVCIIFGRCIFSNPTCDTSQFSIGWTITVSVGNDRSRVATILGGE